VLDGGLPDLSAHDPSTMTPWSTAGELLLEWVVGGIVGGLALGGIVYLVVRLMLSWPSTRRKSA
jgi:uncharacterized protein (DUF2062 family)